MDELQREMVISTPDKDKLPREMIYSPVERTKGVMMYELGELLIKLKERYSDDEMIELINDMVEIIRPFVILYDVDSFYLHDDINKNIDILKEIFKNKKGLLNYIFKIDRVVPINSENGKIFIIKTLSNKYKSSKLLVKVASKDTADPISYEYYVGLTLNNLRIENNIEFFAVMYGRFFCGLDLSIENDKIDNMVLCDDNRFNKKTHLLYEFIRNVETEEVLTLSDYIKKLYSDGDVGIELNIINLMILVLYGLQVAQDKMDFTHYDLHVKNILVVKLSKLTEYRLRYKDRDIIIVTDVIPHIIDYGKSYINPNVAVSENGFKDYELNGEFDDFMMYQNTLFKNYVLDRNDTRYLEMIRGVERHLHKLAYRYLYNRELMKEEEIQESDDTLYFKSYILQLYYNGISEIVDGKFRIIKCDFGIDSRVSNKKYDFFRICKSVSAMMSILSEKLQLHSKDLWKNLGDKLELQYPFHDGLYYSLVSKYDANPMGIIMDRDNIFNEPIDIVYYLYGEVYYKGQLGGMDKNNKKMDKGSENKEKVDLEVIKSNLKNIKVKNEFMNIDYSKSKYDGTFVYDIRDAKIN